MVITMKKLCKLIVLSFILILIGLTTSYTYGFLHPLSLNTNNQITMIDRYGNIMYESNNNHQSSWISIDDIPKNIIDITLLVEDQNFFKHAGIDWLRIMKAMMSNIQNASITQGGSSISQQFVKNQYLNQDVKLSRKIKELFYTIRLEMQYDKKTILENYLNTLYFGHGIYGISDASEYYFQLPLDKLNLKQIVSLIAIPNGPSIYSPILSLENNRNRSNLILSILRKHRYLDQKQYEDALNQPLNLNISSKSIINQYYIDSVLDELKQLNISSHQNLVIYTNYDPFIQNALQNSINSQLNLEDDLQCASIISDSFSGKVLAIVGGKDYTLSQYHRALYGKRQIASTIKPLLYYCALEAGFEPDSKFVSQPTSFYLPNMVYEPQNYQNQYPYKDITMINALALSDNIYAVKTHLFLGENVLCDQLKAFNIESEANPSLALGSVNMSLMQLHQIYNTFASEGIHQEPSFIHSIYQNNQLIYEKKPSKDQLLNRDHVLILNQMLTSVFDEKNSDYTHPTMLGYQNETTMAAKSGSSDWDSYVVAFNPQYTISIWCGYDQNIPLTNSQYSLSKKIYKQICEQILANHNSIWYEPSNNIITRKILPISGEISPKGSEYWFEK